MGTKYLILLNITNFARMVVILLNIILIDIIRSGVVIADIISNTMYTSFFAITKLVHNASPFYVLTEEVKCGMKVSVLISDYIWGSRILSLYSAKHDRS